MKTTLVAAILAAGTLAPIASSYADEVSYGIVECVREMRLRDPAGLADALEHSVKPETGEELIVRLNDGRSVSIVQDGMQVFEPGQRVVVISGPHSARAEPAFQL